MERGEEGGWDKKGYPVPDLNNSKQFHFIAEVGTGFG